MTPTSILALGKMLNLVPKEQVLPSNHPCVPRCDSLSIIFSQSIADDHDKVSAFGSHRVEMTMTSRENDKTSCENVRLRDGTGGKLTLRTLDEARARAGKNQWQPKRKLGG